MKATRQSLYLATSAITLFLATTVAAGTPLVLQRGDVEHTGEYTGLVDLIIDPGFENAKVAVTVDGEKVAAGLLSPWRVSVDFGPIPVQHKITIVATTPQGKRTQWNETINRGNLPLSVRLRRIEGQVFEAKTTSPKDDPIVNVEVWQDGVVVASSTRAPHRFTIPAELLATGFVRITAKTRGGDEAADFWSAAGSIVTEEMQVRTIPIFVSVVDRNGKTRDDVDRAQFRIMDNDAEAMIVEFGKAFDQPISIALLLDASASMLYSMPHAAKAAADFVDRSLKEGDRCSVTAIQDVPRRKQALTGNRADVAAAVRGLEASGRTALFDAIISALRELREEKNRRAIVILTDGGDTGSNYSFEDATKMAREAGIPMYFIAYEGGNEPQDLDRLRFLASETGGFVATATQQNLHAKYEAIERDLRAQFAIKYQISDFGKSNQYRSIRVVMDSPKLEARTIKGYFTP